jgi:hypothetical protein
VKQAVDDGADLAALVEPEYLLALEGFSTSDLIRGQPRAVALFLAIFAAMYGKDPENVKYLTHFLQRSEPDKLLSYRAPGRAAKLIAAMPDQAEGRARLKKFVDENLAGLVDHHQALTRQQERQRATGRKKAEINLREEGKQLVSYMKAADASMHACLRRIAAMQKAERAGDKPPGPGAGNGPRAARRAAPAPGNAGQDPQHPSRGSEPADAAGSVGVPPSQPPGAESTGSEQATSAGAAETPKETPAGAGTTLIDSIDWDEPLSNLSAADAHATSGSSGALDLAAIEAIYRRPAPGSENGPGTAPDSTPGTSAAAPAINAAGAPIFTNEAKTAEVTDKGQVKVGFEAPNQESRGACGGAPGRGAVDSARAAQRGAAAGARPAADTECSPPSPAPATGAEAGSHFPRPP